MTDAMATLGDVLRTWEPANAAAEAFVYEGYDDWRLPHLGVDAGGNEILGMLGQLGWGFYCSGWGNVLIPTGDDCLLGNAHTLVRGGTGPFRELTRTR